MRASLTQGSLGGSADELLAFDSTDKQGGFIGSMFIGGNNVAVDLVREG